MRISSLFIFFLTSFLLVAEFSIAQDGAENISIISDRSWGLVSVPYNFAHAGWALDGTSALTRVEGLSAGLKINACLDERFDPFKGKQAVASYHGFSWKAEEDLLSFVNQNEAVLIADIANDLGKSFAELKAANPHLTQNILPKGASLYGFSWQPSQETWSALTLAYKNYRQDLVEQYEKRKRQTISFLPDPETHEAITYTVQSGDFLGRISDKMGVGLSDLRKWNQLRDNTIYPGQELIVWLPLKKVAAMQEATSTSADSSKEKEKFPGEEAPVNAANTNSKFINYEVKAGDTLWSIARQFPGVSADNIQTWNAVSGVIKPGETLKINTDAISDYSPEKYPSTL